MSTINKKISSILKMLDEVIELTDNNNRSKYVSFHLRVAKEIVLEGDLRRGFNTIDYILCKPLAYGFNLEPAGITKLKSASKMIEEVIKSIKRMDERRKNMVQS